MKDREAQARWGLELPLQWTFYLKDIENFKGLSSQMVEALKEEQSEVCIADLVDALAWAVEHPDADLVSIMPHVQYSNEVLHRYLAVLYRQLRKAQEGGSR